jgi:osmotically-inducible protein OsmY
MTKGGAEERLMSVFFSRSLVAMAAAILVVAAEPALGQISGQSGRGSSGTFGSRSLGGTLSAGQRTFAGSGGQGVQNQAQVGQISGSERYVRGNRQPGQFVGADAADTSSFFSALSAGGLGSGLQGQGNLRGGASALRQDSEQGNDFQGQQSGAGGRSQIPVRVRLQIGFEPPVRESAVAARLQDRYVRITAVEQLSPITVTMEERIAVLQGRVATDHSRDLAARLALLEPGISAVRNELIVGPPLDSGEPSAPGSPPDGSKALP